MQSEMDEIIAKNQHLQEEIDIYEAKMDDEEQKLQELTDEAKDLGAEVDAKE